MSDQLERLNESDDDGRRSHLGWRQKVQGTDDVAKSSPYQQQNDTTSPPKKDMAFAVDQFVPPSPIGRATKPIGFKVDQFISLPKYMAPPPKQPLGFAVDQFISLPKNMVPPPKEPIGVAIDRFNPPPAKRGTVPVPPKKSNWFAIDKFIDRAIRKNAPAGEDQDYVLEDGSNSIK